MTTYIKCSIMLLVAITVFYNKEREDMSKAIKKIKHQLSNANSDLDKGQLELETSDSDLNLLIDYLKVKEQVKYLFEKVSDEVEKLGGDDEEQIQTRVRNRKGKWGVSEEFGTLKQYLYYIMEKYPETRNSDNVLYFTILQEMGAHTLEEAKSLNINLISIHKVRQVIQNKEGLYLADTEVKSNRWKRSSEIREYMRGGK